MDNLVTVMTATFQANLIVAKSYLEDNEIYCFLRDEIASQVYSVASSQGVQLQVRESDAERAIQLYNRGRFCKGRRFRLMHFFRDAV